MSDNKPIFPFTDAQVIESMRAEIEKAEASDTKRPIEKFVLAALSSIPWIGSFVSAAASLRSEVHHLHNELRTISRQGSADSSGHRFQLTSRSMRSSNNSAFPRERSPNDRGRAHFECFLQDHSALK